MIEKKKIYIKYSNLNHNLYIFIFMKQNFQIIMNH